MDEYTQNLKKEYIEYKKYAQIQASYAGLLLKAITDVCDANLMKKIIDRHFQLMHKFDKSSKNSTHSE